LINEIKTNKPAVSSGQGINKQKSTSAQNVKQSAPPLAVRSAVSLAAAVGLPPDKLSSSIISFARFFSLPLKPQLLADIRRQALLPQPQQQTTQQAKPQQGLQQSSLQAAVLLKTREALSLSAAAAESKGIELLPKGLESYTEAVDPDSRRQNRDKKQDKQNNDKNEQNEKAEKELIKTGTITADSLKKSAYDYAENNKLLDILNSLPGINGQRWIVIPFNFSNDKSDFNVSMRILLDKDFIKSHAVCMALDIIESGDTEQRRLFVMESANERPVRLTIYFKPELPKKHHLQVLRELSDVLKIPLERIVFKASEETFPCEADSEQFSSIDEAV